MWKTFKQGNFFYLWTNFEKGKFLYLWTSLENLNKNTKMRIFFLICEKTEFAELFWKQEQFFWNYEHVLKLRIKLGRTNIFLNIWIKIKNTNNFELLNLFWKEQFFKKFQSYFAKGIFLNSGTKYEKKRKKISSGQIRKAQNTYYNLQTFSMKKWKIKLKQ